MQAAPAPPAKKSNAVLFVLVGAGCLVGLPCVVCMIGLAINAISPVDPAMMAAGRADIVAYNGRVTALVAALPDPSGTAVPCAPEVILAGHTQQDSSGRKYIPSLRFESLQRWASATPAPEDDGFAWLDSIERVDPVALSDHEVGNARFRVNGWAQQRFLAVFRAGIARAPKVIDGDFESGLFIGRMLIVDTMTAQTVCHAPVAAQSSESVAVGGLLNPDDADDAVRADLRDQLQVAATDALRSISADLFLGTSPTIGR